MLVDSQDSNVERDYEYGGDKLNTKPEISFTLSTPSKAKPQRGPEADSTWNVMIVIALKELHDLDFTIADLFETYIMSRHGRTEHTYLSTHRGKEPLVDGLPDTDKWANFYVEVSGNYEFGDQTNHRHHVPKIDCFSLSFFLYLQITEPSQRL